jgi:hypothetical protein
VHPPTQLFLDLFQLYPHAVTAGLPLELKLHAPRDAADEGKSQEGEGLRFAKPALLAVARSVATELDQPGLLRMKRQRELLEPCAFRVIGIVARPTLYERRPSRRILPRRDSPLLLSL